ncbi:MAG: rhodanese-like domain-containing protein [Arenicellales bacterium]
MNADNRSAPLRRDYDFVRSKLLNREEIALLDVREEAPHAGGHPLFAANLPLARIELDAYTKLPRRSVPIVTLDAGEGLAERAAGRLLAMGYSDVAVFEGGLEAWKAAGGEVFVDVNVPSKAFGELVESVCHTPSVAAEEVKAMIDAGEDMVIVDARRFDEYQAMSIPTGISVPGAELVLRVPDLAPSPTTRVIVNCAGRTRSLIGSQSLINAGLPNPVAALRNGTMGWTLAAQPLDAGQSRSFGETPGVSVEIARRRARAVADRAGVGRAARDALGEWMKQEDRTTYFFDVRSLEEYEAGHLPGFFPMPGGQLVQETEMYAPVRGARVVLADDDGARANMTASWLAQMAWDVYVVDGLAPGDFSETGAFRPTLPALPANREIDAATLQDWLASGDVVVVDVAKHAIYHRGHVPGAWYALRSGLGVAAALKLPVAARYVVTSDDGLLAQFTAPELRDLVEGDVYVLTGGTRAWSRGGYPLEAGEGRLASEPIDRYRRPYEGTVAPLEAMQAYLDWELRLVEQLGRDGTHHFRPLSWRGPPASDPNSHAP